MRSLSTSQLVILWYGGLIISLMVWDVGSSNFYKASSAALLTALLIYTS